MRRYLVAVLIVLAMAGLSIPTAAADPIYDPFCIDVDVSIGPMVTVCTPD